LLRELDVRKFWLNRCAAVASGLLQMLTLDVANIGFGLIRSLSRQVIWNRIKVLKANEAIGSP